MIICSMLLASTVIVCICVRETFQFLFLTCCCFVVISAPVEYVNIIFAVSFELFCFVFDLLLLRCAALMSAPVVC
jgi:hypothetical protein